jgi:hypothetical protein
MAAHGWRNTVATLGLIAFAALIAAQVLSVVYAARYSAIPVRARRR